MAWQTRACHAWVQELEPTTLERGCRREEENEGYKIKPENYFVGGCTITQYF